MENRLRALLEQLRGLERELLAEWQRTQQRFVYEIREKRVLFTPEVQAAHRKLAKPLWRYLRDARLLHILTAPVVWSFLVPALLLDGTLWVYQRVCFPIYGIPRVPRGRYLVLDRHYLSYLNPLERLNCLYCSYFNGLMAYAGEVAARTEQYWCPIKHARPTTSYHSRYPRFLDYGDGEGYRREVARLRRDFADLTEEGEGPRP